VNDPTTGACVTACTSSQIRNSAGVCVSNCVAGASNAVSDGNGGSIATVTGQGALPGPTVCVGGCVASTPSQCTGVGIGPSAYWVCSGKSSTNTGEACTGGTGSGGGNQPVVNPIQPSSPAAQCAEQGMGYGTVGTTVVCVPASNSSSSASSSKTVTKPDGTTATQNVTTTEVCTGDGSCTTSTSTSVTGGGVSGTATNGTTTTTTQSTGSGSAACLADPTSASCAGDVAESPGDPVGPKASDISSAFFNGTFSNLLSWQVPGHSSVCPTGQISFTLFGRAFNLVMDAQCTLLNNPSVSSVANMAFQVLWVVAALFILLGA